jgi:hypothetical protein
LKSEAALCYLHQVKFRYYFEDEIHPENISEIKLFPSRKLAMIKGRIKNRPKVRTSNKVFSQGSL